MKARWALSARWIRHLFLVAMFDGFTLANACGGTCRFTVIFYVYELPLTSTMHSNGGKAALPCGFNRFEPTGTINSTSTRYA
jgi:hypothetical protein